MYNIFRYIVHFMHVYRICSIKIDSHFILSHRITFIQSLVCFVYVYSVASSFGHCARLQIWKRIDFSYSSGNVVVTKLVSFKRNDSYSLHRFVSILVWPYPPIFGILAHNSASSDCAKQNDTNLFILWFGYSYYSIEFRVTTFHTVTHNMVHLRCARC